MIVKRRTHASAPTVEQHSTSAIYLYSPHPSDTDHPIFVRKVSFVIRAKDDRLGPFKKKSLVGLPSLSGFIDLDGNMVIATEVSQRQQF